MSDGISRRGREAEGRFCALTGAELLPPKSAADAILYGRPVEIKTCTGRTVSQVRPHLWMPLVVYAPDAWYVVPPHMVLALACDRKRGQHGENPFECCVLTLHQLRDYRCTGEELCDRLEDAWRSAAGYPEAEDVARGIADECAALARKQNQAILYALFRGEGYFTTKKPSAARVGGAA
jgi:hypothetical protein